MPGAVPVKAFVNVATLVFDTAAPCTPEYALPAQFAAVYQAVLPLAPQVALTF